jgi:hypothetical protein
MVERERVGQKDQKIGKYEDGSEQVIGALIEVHRALGPGLLESAYEACFAHELGLRDLPFEPVGLLVNFNVTSLRQGLRRLSLPYS